MAPDPLASRAAPQGLRSILQDFGERRPATAGVVLIVVGSAFFACMHAGVRFVSADIDPFEIAFFRNLFGFMLFTPMLVRSGLKLFHTRRFRAHLGRGAINSFSMLAWFTALSMIPLADATALANARVPNAAGLLEFKEAQTTISDPDEGFLFERLFPGPFTVTASSFFAQAPDSFSGTIPHPDPITLILRKNTGTLLGCVLDPDGESQTVSSGTNARRSSSIRETRAGRDSRPPSLQ